MIGVIALGLLVSGCARSPAIEQQAAQEAAAACNGLSGYFTRVRCRFAHQAAAVRRLNAAQVRADAAYARAHPPPPAPELSAAQRAAQLRAAAAMLQPTRTGTFGESLGNGLGAYAGVPPPAPPRQTVCQWVGSQLICSSE